MRSIYTNSQDSNLGVFSRRLTASRYKKDFALFPAETVIFEQIAQRCAMKPIMDLGVGGGRTTEHLLKISNDYLGVDYSAEMIVRCNGRFKNVRFEQADARNLSRFPGNHFAFILFSFNGIDYVPHEDRLVILQQVHQCLVSDGLFSFSSHNKLSKVVSPLNPDRIWTMNPLKFVWRLGLYFSAVARYFRLRKLIYEEHGHARRIDGAFNFSLVTYYVDPAEQKRQLEAAGFELLSIYDSSGKSVEIDSGSTDQWLYYLAKKCSA